MEAKEQNRFIIVAAVTLLVSWKQAINGDDDNGVDNHVDNDNNYVMHNAHTYDAGIFYFNTKGMFFLIYPQRWTNDKRMATGKYLGGPEIFHSSGMFIAQPNH